ncbi:polyprenyl synthetase family protein [Actinoplanes sp. NPDC051411]|uniref:polyprenyl synthetase family protein n=1 Tax=Actinoplanes sp. NPDC051411 TaxID=3155522 RepID=UPI003438747D
MTPASTLSMPELRCHVQPAMRAALDRLDRMNRLVAGYQLGFWNADGSPALPGGKELPAWLALLAARAAGGRYSSGVPAGVAVEFVHNFSLIHDDVMEGNPQRHGRPTSWAVFGVGRALLAGDALLALAAEIVAPADRGTAAVQRLGGAVRRLTAGHAAELDIEQRESLDLDECLGIAADKTGALLSCSGALGTLAGGGPPQLVEKMASFGGHLGVAVQLVDDVLGIWGDVQVTGKPAGADLRAGKRTLPVVRAAMGDPFTARAVSEFYRRRSPHSATDVQRIADLVEAAGGRAWAGDQAWREATAALTALHGAAISAAARSDLHKLAEFVVEQGR